MRRKNFFFFPNSAPKGLNDTKKKIRFARAYNTLTLARASAPDELYAEIPSSQKKIALQHTKIGTRRG